MKSSRNPELKPAPSNATLVVPAPNEKLPWKVVSLGCNTTTYAVPVNDCPVFVRPKVPLRLKVTKLVVPSVQTVLPVQLMRKLAVVFATAGAVVIKMSPRVATPHGKANSLNALAFISRPFHFH